MRTRGRSEATMRRMTDAPHLMDIEQELRRLELEGPYLSEGERRRRYQAIQERLNEVKHDLVWLKKIDEAKLRIKRQHNHNHHCYSRGAE